MALDRRCKKCEASLKQKDICFLASHAHLHRAWQVAYRCSCGIESPKYITHEDDLDFPKIPYYKIWPKNEARSSCCARCEIRSYHLDIYGEDRCCNSKEMKAFMAHGYGCKRYPDGPPEAGSLKAVDDGVRFGRKTPVCYCPESHLDACTAQLKLFDCHPIAEIVLSGELPFWPHYIPGKVSLMSVDDDKVDAAEDVLGLKP